MYQRKNKTIAEKIEKDWHDKCLHPNERELIECLINAVDEISTKSGLTNEWEKVKPQIQNHFDAWKPECTHHLYVFYLLVKDYAKRFI